MSAVPRVIALSDSVRVGGGQVGGFQSTYLIDSNTWQGLLVSSPHHRLKNGAWSGGGPLYVYKRTIANVGTVDFPFTAFGIDWKYRLHGCTYKNSVWPSTVIPPSWASQVDFLNGQYAEAYAKARPGSPVAGVFQFVTELRDLPRIPLQGAFGFRFIKPKTLGDIPKMLKLKTEYFKAAAYKNAGSEYLNYQFGWAPFVRDLQKMYYLWKSIDKRMAQIVRENNKWVRRKATVMSDTSTTVEEEVQPYFGYNVPGSPPDFFLKSAVKSTTCRCVTKTKERIWFSGRFKYHIPDTGSSLWNAKARLALFGALPSPEQVWAVLPWSWLADYFGNTGAIMANLSGPLSAVDNLASDYSYIMHERIVTKVKTSATYLGPVSEPATYKTGYEYQWGPVDFTFSQVDEEVTRTRVGGGSPFLPGVKYGDLTSHQLGILAALGISRDRVPRL